MAAVAAPVPARSPSSLLQRRLSQAQYSSIEMAGLMSTFNMTFRPHGMPGISLPFDAGQQQQAYHHSMQPNGPSLAPSDLFQSSVLHPTANIGAESSFSLPYDGTEGFNGGSFGNLSWAPPAAARPFAPQPGYVLRQPSNSSSDSETYIKSEDESPVQPCLVLYDASAYSTSPSSMSPMEAADATEARAFSTDIDTLMRAIQSKVQAEPKAESADNPVELTSYNKPKKRYLCNVEGCGKAFYQKTHLEIHTRAHTGVKPFLCKEPSCGQRFSQLGNLKTHERRHTGERPYHCDICGKTFAQHGNVRAHKIVHTSAKPFTCKLDDCKKQFTQLGNLKSHQNKFHVDTIRRLKSRFENFKEGDVVDSWEKEMWQYFASLYVNCNKGIKGRGKDRRISSTSMTPRRSSDSYRRDSMVSASSSSGNLL